MLKNNSHHDLVIIASRFNTEICDALIYGAQCYLKQQGLTADLVRVPGAFELPVVARNLVCAGAGAGAGGVIALGCVIKGDTDHFEYVCQGCTYGLMQVMLDHGVPVGFGVLMTDTLEQAQMRSSYDHMTTSSSHVQEAGAGNKGYEVAAAVVETMATLSDVSKRD